MARAVPRRLIASSSLPAIERSCSEIAI